MRAHDATQDRGGEEGVKGVAFDLGLEPGAAGVLRARRPVSIRSS